MTIKPSKTKVMVFNGYERGRPKIIVDNRVVNTETNFTYLIVDCPRGNELKHTFERFDTLSGTFCLFKRAYK